MTSNKAFDGDRADIGGNPNNSSPVHQGAPPGYMGTQEKTNTAFSNGSLKSSTSVRNGHVSPTRVRPSETVVTPVNPGEPTPEEKARAQRNRDPIFFCRWITARPKMSFALALGGHLMLLLITLALIRLGVDVIPLEFGRVPMEITTDDDYLRGKAWSYKDTVRADNPVAILKRGSVSKAENTSERTGTGDVLTLMFELKGGNVFTKENLKAIEQVEDRLYNHEEFKDYCKLDSIGNCTKANSIIRYFDGSMKMIDPVFDDPNFDNIAAVLDRANASRRTKATLQVYLGKNSNINSSLNIAESQITRSFLYLGMPLPGYANSSDRNAEQDKKIERFMGLSFLPIMDGYVKSGVNGMDFIYNSGALFGSYLMKQSIQDMMLAGGSVAFLFCFMWFQTGSLWITGWAIFSVITSFAGANLIYRFVLDFRYFGTFHILAIFIILGIGADDVFVFTDTWKSTGHYDYPSLAHRMSDCYRKAAAAMLYTSMTTAIAFIVSATSPLLAVSSFGVFSGVLIIVNYLSVIIFFPTVVITHHLSWEQCTWCCCIPCKRKREKEMKNGGIQNGGIQNNGFQGDQNAVVAMSVVGDPYEKQQIPSSPQGSTAAIKSENHQRRNPIVRFFRGPFYRFISHRIVKWVNLVIFVILTAVFIYFATGIEPNEESIKFLSDESNFGKALDRSDNAFTPSQTDDSLKVSIIWGLKKQDYSKCHMTDLTCLGRSVWDDKFHLNSAPAQRALLGFCEKLKSLSASDADKLKIKRNIITGIPEVKCFMEEMNDFMKVETSLSPPRYPNGTNLTLPLLQSGATAIMTYNPLIYNTSMLTATGTTFSNYFEIGMSYWMYGGFRPVSNAAKTFRDYNSLLGIEEIPAVTMKKTVPLTGSSYIYGTRLRYAAIVVNTTLLSRGLGYPKGLPVREEWESFVNAEISQMPESLRGGFQTTVGFNAWHWLKVQKVLTSTALNGILIGVGLSFPILVLATQNLITGLFAVLNISLVTVAVVGIIPMAGWKLGILESINLVLVVGLAVDYTVHLAEGYSRSSHSSRSGRLYDMLDEVGISVLSGAVTTLGASLFMLFAQILFFSQFGIFMFCTIGFSILYALGFFVTILAICGPQNDFGTLKAIFCFWKKQ